MLERDKGVAGVGDSLDGGVAPSAAPVDDELATSSLAHAGQLSPQLRQAAAWRPLRATDVAALASSNNLSWFHEH